MPEKYRISRREVFPRSEPISKFCSIEIDKCLRCLQCVKHRACVYGIYDRRSFDPLQVVDTGDSQCGGCFRCIQECKNNIIARVRNSRFDALGDDYWTPDLLVKIWAQAQTGNIPVSGSGYAGPFTGPGFDQMWTDMSEIVRPTRDGIHGREYISTVTELGRKPAKLEFDERGDLVSEPPLIRELPIPILLDLPDTGKLGRTTRTAMVMAARELGTLAVADFDEATGFLAEYRKNLVVRIDPPRNNPSELEGVPVLEMPYAEDVMESVRKLKQTHPDSLVSIRLDLDEHASERTSALAGAGAEIIHLQAAPGGRGLGERTGEFVTTLVREIHLRLVDDTIREQVTLILSGGIAMAEHMTKIVICGVDAVGVDRAVLVALDCRLCRDCSEEAVCPVDLDRIPVAYGVQRLINLMGSWHSQLIELLGAMGLREVRRLRGEIGRAMFFEDLEKENFAPIFGERKNHPVKGDVSAAEKDVPEVRFQVSDPWSFPPVRDKVEICATRYRNRLSKYKVVRTNACVACGRCAGICSYGVHEKAVDAMLPPRSYLCAGPDHCRRKDQFCADACPEEAVRIGKDPVWETFGDPRWTADLIVSTWMQAETGRPPENDLEYRKGNSGGGFDRIDFLFPETPPEPSINPAEIDLSIPLNRRKGDSCPQIVIGFPVYGGGMSFGSISLATLVARAKAYEAFNSFTCTGEGGYPEALKKYDDSVITQIATGLFGVREETIQRVRIVEFKYAQGAKPGLGGHLLGDKVTPAVAKMREAVEGSSLFSPFPFHSVYSVEDHKKHVDWVKIINPKALVSVKVSTPTDVDMVAVGSFYAGAHIIHLDGSYGGTGAAPDIAKKNIAMPIEYAIPKVHQFLVEEGVRDQMTLIASGGIRTAWDIAKAIALGADGVVLGTSEMVAVECIRCSRCESGRGCPRGIATTDPELAQAYDVRWASQRIINLFHSFSIQLQEILWRLGMHGVQELVGRSDLLTHRDYQAGS